MFLDCGGAKNFVPAGGFPDGIREYYKDMYVKKKVSKSDLKKEEMQNKKITIRELDCTGFFVELVGGWGCANGVVAILLRFTGVDTPIPPLCAEEGVAGRFLEAPGAPNCVVIMVLVAIPWDSATGFFC